MQGCKQSHMNLKILGCKDAKIQANIHEYEDMRIRGCEDTSRCIGT